MGEGMILGLKRGEVRLVPHQHEWRAAFVEEKNRLALLLGESALRIEHIGSTAVPDLPSKPVIDVAIAVRSFEVINSWPAILKEVGYTYFGDREGRGDHFFAKGPDEKRTFYVHVVPIESDRWRDYLKFRDALLANSPTRAAYADLKRLAAENHAGSRFAYTEAKDAWIQKVLNEKPGQPLEPTLVAPSVPLSRARMSAQIITDIVDQCVSANALFIVGIDGCGGAGKSRLATEVRAALVSRGRDISVVQMDNFYFPSALRNANFARDAVGGAFDWQRLRDQILAPLRAGQPARYQRYDWPSDALAEWHDVPHGIVIVEGVYSTRVELKEFYHLTVWVECPRPIRLARGIERDGEAARRKWEDEWMPAEDRYVLEQSPHTQADVVYAGS